MSDDVQFLYCRDCDALVRSTGSQGDASDDSDRDPEVARFATLHADCRTERLAPTGRASASLPWHEPLAERRIEVAGSTGIAVAIGSRTTLEDPLRWRLERAEIEEHVILELDRAAFARSLDRTFHPHHLAVRTSAAWAALVEEFVQRLPLCEILVLDDDPSDPEATHAGLTLTARTSLEATLRRGARDEASAEHLARAFADSTFPPLRLRRRLTLKRGPARIGSSSPAAPPMP